MSPALSCAWTTGLMTDYLEGALPFHRLAGVRLHLGVCPRCRAFLASLKSLPTLLRAALAEPAEAAEAAEAAPPALGASLISAMARIAAGEAKSPMHHPAGAMCEALRSGEADEALRMLQEVHLDLCAPCRREHPAHSSQPLGRAGALPERLLGRVKPESEWKWTRHGLRGAKVAEVFKDPSTGSTLWFSFLPGGARFPDHFHDGLEAALVLNGWLQDGPVLAGPGDCLVHEEGSGHAPQAESRDGCWILARTGPGGLRFKGWRRFFG